MIFLVLSIILQQQNNAKQQRHPSSPQKLLLFGTQTQLSGLREMKHYIQLFTEKNAHWRLHILYMPKLERPFSMPTKAPATEMARRGTRQEQRQHNSLSMRSARKPSQLLQLQCFSSWSQPNHLSRNTSSNRAVLGNLERMLLGQEDLFPN